MWDAATIPGHRPVPLTLTAAAALALTVAACAPVPSPGSPVPGVGADGPRGPVPGEPPGPRLEADNPLTGRLPPVPDGHGMLDLRVVYPPEGAAVAVRDSTFIFGATGTGAARLRINQHEVEVAPNGAFLGFIPVPSDGLYRLVAVAGADSLVLERRVTVPPPPASAGPAAELVEGSARPRGALVASPAEPIAVSVRGTPGGAAWLRLPDGTRIPLVEGRATDDPAWGQRAFGTDTARLSAGVVRGVAEYRGSFQAVPLLAPDTAMPRPRLTGGAGLPPGPAGPGTAAIIELAVGADTARAPLPLNLATLDPARPRVGMLVDDGAPGVSGDATVVGRPAPGFTYHWFWPNGTLVALDGERDGSFRVRLTPDLAAWVDAGEVRLLPAGTPPPGGRVGTVRFTPVEESVDVRISLDEPIPFRVDAGEQSLEITLYGGRADTGWLQYGGIDPLISRAEWSQPADHEYRLTLHLPERPWGYLARWAENGDLIVRVRRPPAIDRERPLTGIRVVVDPGHPPGGATGPTGLTEADANLFISRYLRPLLEARGAHVVMTREDRSTVPLVARPWLATQTDGHILVSVHNNAFPDGVNPFENAGTSVYYFQPWSVELAWHLQRELLAELGLRNLGIGRANLALARPTWMPSALTETMFMMVPVQEAALRNPGVQERIARAHVRALEAFLLERGAPRWGSR